ncbi:hypothetical protein, partial [Rhizobium leguminosarum]|uniref:hypothetical protein n=1 Tax=Rhizobium leguminosarum TaxID=384 RepID=UPI001AECA6B4
MPLLNPNAFLNPDAMRDLNPRLLPCGGAATSPASAILLDVLLPEPPNRKLLEPARETSMLWRAPLNEFSGARDCGVTRIEPPTD